MLAPIHARLFVALTVHLANVELCTWLFLFAAVHRAFLVAVQKAEQAPAFAT